jgi:hypothetical protein
MNTQTQSHDLAPDAYEPPAVRLLGNVHDLLAQSKSSAECDMDASTPGMLPASDPACQ